MDNTKITLIDAITNSKYTFFVSNEDAKKAESDIVFAQTLLNHAKINYENVNEDVVETTAEADIIESQETIKDKKYWQYEDTLKLICTIESYYEDLNHPKKRKTVWDTIACDLGSHHVEVTATECHKKWQNLLRTYKACADNIKKSGRGPTRFSFYDRMNEFLGKEASNSSPHTVDVYEVLDIEDTAGQSNQPLDENLKSSSSEGIPEKEKATKSRKRTAITSEYMQVKTRYLEYKEAEMKRKQNFDRKLEESMNELLKKKLELEERKVNALEQLIELKKKELGSQ